MKFQTKATKLQYDPSNNIYVFSCIVPQTQADSLNKLSARDCIKTVEVDVYREKRSLNANAYCWTIIHKIAQKLGSTDEEIYLGMLDKYGTHQYVAVLEEAVPMLKAAFKRTKTVGTCKLNDKTGVTVKCTLGSSEYDSKMMSVFIDGIVQDAKELGIETMTNEELERLLKNENTR